MRAAAVGDARAILDVRARSWQEAYAHVFPADDLERQVAQAGEWVGWWEEMIAGPAPHMHTIVADRAGEVVGFAHLGAARGESPDEVGELYAIYVDSGRWGTGAGRVLIEAAEASLRSAAFREAMLWVLEGNERAERFYRAAGWTHDGGRKVDEFRGAEVTELRYRKRL